MKKINLKSVALLAFAALIAQVVITWLYSLIFKIQTTQMFSISIPTPATGIGGQMLGNKILGYLSGIIPVDFSFTYLIAMYIGAFALVYAGMWIYELDFAFKGNNLSQRLFAILAYGHIILFAALYLLKMSVPGIALNLLIGLAINLILVSALITFSAKKFNFPRI